MTTETKLPELDMIGKMALQSWRHLNQVISALTEEQMQAMIEFELLTKRRADIITRLHQRFSVKRQSREIADIMVRREQP